MIEELKLCPFCGKEAHTDDGLAWCSDDECFLADINMPINEWNDRPIEDAQVQCISELEATLKKIIEDDGAGLGTWAELYQHLKDIARNELEKKIT